MPEMVLCVPSEKVWFEDTFTSLLKGTELINHITANNHLYDLLDFNTTLLYRDKAEDDINYKQIIVYGIVSNGKQWYKYCRGEGDERLVANYSIGIGGHVNLADVKRGNYDMFMAIENAIMRELWEELRIKDMYYMREMVKWIGVINDNSNRVGQVHLGIIFELIMKDPLFRVEPGLLDTGFEDIEKIKENIEKYESWSQILIRELGG